MKDGRSIAEIVDYITLENAQVSVVLTETPGDILELIAELEYLGTEENFSVSSLVFADTTGLLGKLQGFNSKDYVIVSKLGQASEEELRMFDAKRNALEGGPRLTIVVSAVEAAVIRASMPNLWSWIGSDIWRSGSSGITSVADRLEYLQFKTGLNDQEVRDMATSDTLPDDHFVAEYLALLGRP